MTIAGYFNKVNALLSLENSIIEEAVKANLDEIVMLNKQQMYAGKNKDNTPIEPPYTQFTVRIKQAKGQPSDRVTLFDTGDFYNALQVEYLPHKMALVFESKDWKEKHLLEKYGDKIFGVPQDKKEDLRALIQSEIKKCIIDLLNK